ncbi:MAG: hypothetical protein GWO20_18775 [Candidatus Korarchaeota archaeon]|nr:hypothetical protein [Candidatus Korarchaeota archaeon]NIU85307.1 hypothetical protein [Candidatus Thorarchaeota archaeon]NIW15407.1 hypothetical protein [Candidatus Thorarchaeota archaeon]NIW53351.1 hypothetical protein [Candidatus Korarchaeota archaeon]
MKTREKILAGVIITLVMVGIVGYIKSVRAYLTPMTITRAGITAGIEKRRFPMGQNITFWLENNRNNTIYFGSPCPWHIEQNVYGKWEVVFSFACAAVMVPFPPGETKTWAWDQRTFHTRAIPGVYRVVIRVSREEFYLPFNIG